MTKEFAEIFRTRDEIIYEMTNIIELRVDVTGIATQEEAERQNRLPSPKIINIDAPNHTHNNPPMLVLWSIRKCVCGGGQLDPNDPKYFRGYANSLDDLFNPAHPLLEIK